MLILPAIDLLDGKCVRLAQGDYAREKVYSDDPVSLARQFEQEGAEWLHVVDLDGAKSGVPKNRSSISRIAQSTQLKIEFGGGVRSLEIAQELLDEGAARVVVGTKLIQDPILSEAFFERFGDRVVAGIDVRNGRVAVSGWVNTSEQSPEELAAWAEGKGCKRIILTDISRDGMLTGPNLALLAGVSAKVAIPVIQSGGISSLLDIECLLSLHTKLPEGVIIGRAIYEGRFSVAEAVKLIRTRPRTSEKLN